MGVLICYITAPMELNFTKLTFSYNKFYFIIALMHVYVTQANFTTKPRFKLKISEVSQKWIPKAVELKRIPTHKKCKCKKFCSQTRLVGEIYSSDVIMHRGYSLRSVDISNLSIRTYKVEFTYNFGISRELLKHLKETTMREICSL